MVIENIHQHRKQFLDGSNDNTAILDPGRLSAWDPWLRSVGVMHDGKEKRAVELVSSDRKGHATIPCDLYGPLLEHAKQSGVAWAYGVGHNNEVCRDLECLNFEERFQLVLRRQYLGLTALHGHLKAGKFGLRQVASMGRQIRKRLFEMDLDQNWLTLAESVFASRQASTSFALTRAATDLHRRFAIEDYGFLVLRRRTGEGIDAYVVFEEYEDTKGRLVLRLLDFWTIKASRRSLIWLMGELAVWALAVGVDIIETFVIKGSETEQAVLASGAVRNKGVYPVYTRTLGEREMPESSGSDLRAADFSLGDLGRT